MKNNLTGLYVITDKKLIKRAGFIETVEKSIKGGARIVQLREKDTPQNEILNLGRELLKLTRRYDVPLIINDSPELAKEIGADGVHLGGDDTSIKNARAILGDEAIIGVSCYNQIERGLNAVQNGADYVAFGTPYYTPTKPEREPTSIEVLKEAVYVISQIPIFAIGGITKENASEILGTGVDGIAVITSVFGSPDPENAARELATLSN
ncbi:MAG: thiamine phosphate synthase [Candidatus Dadabacteria bacterium]|nr:thiamine phosphate synthase [Candidatus Dadabacteria bacterium]MCZ6864540.1 thiamine phosphate synthase [Candidatus Dadabacteria bacterium]